jgi:hypothetical protein
MKKTLFMMIAAAAMLMAGAANAQTPEKVAKQFLTALYSGDVSIMMKCLTEEDAKTAAKHTWKGDAEKLAILKKSEVKVFDNDYTSSIKIVRFYYPKRDTNKKNNGSFAAVSLIKEKGEWKVSRWGH